MNILIRFANINSVGLTHLTKGYKEYIYILLMNQNWSDDEDYINDDELTQPNRDFPISDEEEEEEEYDMYELTQLTINKQNTDDLFKNDKSIEINKNKSGKDNININIKKNNNISVMKINKKRAFNPRLPPPDKYNKNIKNNDFKLNSNDFPKLK